MIVPVTDAASAALVTQKLQEATTIQTHIGAWVMRRHEHEPFTGQVHVDFTIKANTLDEAKAEALAWTRAELARGKPVQGAGEPAIVETA